MTVVAQGLRSVSFAHLTLLIIFCKMGVNEQFVLYSECVTFSAWANHVSKNWNKITFSSLFNFVNRFFQGGTSSASITTVSWTIATSCANVVIHASRGGS